MAKTKLASAHAHDELHGGIHGVMMSVSSDRVVSHLFSWKTAPVAKVDAQRSHVARFVTLGQASSTAPLYSTGSVDELKSLVNASGSEPYESACATLIQTQVPKRAWFDQSHHDFLAVPLVLALAGANSRTL